MLATLLNTQLHQIWNIHSTAHWLSFTDSKDVQKVMAKLTIKVQGGRMAKE
jgi:hypothetical protein